MLYATIIVLSLYVCVQVDVLESQYSVLVEKIKSTDDFETVKSAHRNFLGTLQSQLFFTLDPVSAMLCIKTSLKSQCMEASFNANGNMYF